MKKDKQLDLHKIAELYKNSWIFWKCDCLKGTVSVRPTHPADTVWQPPWRSSGKQACCWVEKWLLWSCWKGQWRRGNLCVWRCNREGTYRKTAPLRHLSSAVALLQTDWVLAHRISNRLREKYRGLMFTPWHVHSIEILLIQFFQLTKSRKLSTYSIIWTYFM